MCYFTLLNLWHAQLYTSGTCYLINNNSNVNVLCIINIINALKLLPAILSEMLLQLSYLYLNFFKSTRI